MKEYKTSESSRKASEKYQNSEKYKAKVKTSEFKTHRKRYMFLYRLKNYGITEEYYNQMLQEQNNSCYLCTKPFNDTYSNKACIDHNHATGKVRHLLCRICNLMVGHCKDNIEIVSNSIEYLTHWKEIANGK